jgi:hypothetical protein
VTVVVSGTPTPALATNHSYYHAEGRSAEYSAGGFEDGFVQHGRMSLVEGLQYVTFSRNFLDTSYTFSPVPNDGEVYAIEGSEEVGRIQIYSAGINTNFRWTAHGRRG